MSVKTKIKDKQKAKRKPRSKFRPTFRQRSVFSFGKAFVMLNEATDKDADLSEHAKGMYFMSCLKFLSHSIEMLSKATLVGRSPFLVLKELTEFDKMFSNKNELEGETCGGYVALARASKIFKKDIRPEELAKLNQIIKKRNLGEHREFYISNFDQERHLIVSGAELVVAIYDSQFKNANLLQEASECLNVDLTNIYLTILEISSDEYAKVQKKLKKLGKAGRAITVCEKCYYETALLSEDKKIYECLWCEDKKFHIKCSVHSCSNHMWSTSDDVKQKCRGMHFLSNIEIDRAIGLEAGGWTDLFISNELKHLIDKQKNINEKIEPLIEVSKSVSSALPRLTDLSHVLKLSDLARLGSVNPKGDDTEDDEIDN